MRMRKLGTLAVFVLAASCGRTPDPAASAPTEAWNSYNDPSRFGLATAHIDTLPRSGQVDTSGFWSGDYWPTYKGGIANRWQSGGTSTDYRSYQYRFLTRDEASRLTESEIARLSPAEKYDLFLGRLDFPLAKAEWANTQASVGGDGYVPTWFGLCHGWAAAALADMKPGTRAVARSTDGRAVTFYAADLEALAIYAHSDMDVLPTAAVGARCNTVNPTRDAYGRIVDPECRDTNPASFHLALVGTISSQRKPFVMDSALAHEVWNTPVFGYRYAVGQARYSDGSDYWRYVRAPGTVYLVDVTMVVDHAVGATSGFQAPRLAASASQFQYTLELDAAGNIIGGEWLSEDRPDFLWRPTSAPTSPAHGLVAMGTVKALVGLSRVPTPGPTPGPTPDPGPGPSPDARVEARMLSLVNAHLIPYLTRVIGLSLEGARAVHSYVAGPDQNRHSADDRPLRSLAELRAVIIENDVATLAAFALRSP